MTDIKGWRPPWYEAPMTYRAPLATLVAALLWTSPAHAGDDLLEGKDLDAYVDSIVEAYGGAKAVAKLAAYRLEGTVEAHIMGGSGKFRRDFTAPDSLRVELVYPDRTETRILAGDEAWRGSPKELTAVDGVRRTSMVYQMIRATAPWFLDANRAKLTHVGDNSTGHRKYRTLRLAWSDALNVDFWIDDETHLVELVLGTLTVKGQSMTFATRYEKYKRVGGVMIPHQESSFVNQQHTGTTVIEKVKLGAKKLGPFAPPKGAVKEPHKGHTKHPPLH